MEEATKNIIEQNPVAFATVDLNGNPHVIAVAYVKVKDEKLVLTDNYMKTTCENIKQNPSVSLAVWNKEWVGYRIDGKAQYSQEGEWYDFVKSIEENKNEPCNGAIVIDISKITKLG